MYPKENTVEWYLAQIDCSAAYDYGRYHPRPDSLPAHLHWASVTNFADAFRHCTALHTIPAMTFPEIKNDSGPL